MRLGPATARKPCSKPIQHRQIKSTIVILMCLHSTSQRPINAIANYSQSFYWVARQRKTHTRKSKSPPPPHPPHPPPHPPPPQHAHGHDHPASGCPRLGAERDALTAPNPPPPPIPPPPPLLAPRLLLLLAPRLAAAVGGKPLPLLPPPTQSERTNHNEYATEIVMSVSVTRVCTSRS